MAIRAVFFDFGGVIMRTEFQAPRQHLAERFNMDYDDIDRVVFASESARRASVGEITEEAHWAEVLKRLKHPVSEAKTFSDEFFGGDVIDRVLVEYIRSLRGKFHTGLISNAWSGLRSFLTRENIIDIFDTVTISAEVGRPNRQRRYMKLRWSRPKSTRTKRSSSMTWLQISMPAK